MKKYETVEDLRFDLLHQSYDLEELHEALTVLCNFVVEQEQRRTKMYGIVAIPTYVLDEINAKLDKAIADCPDAEKERDILRRQLVGFVNEHGYVPEFSLAKNEHGD